MVLYIGIILFINKLYMETFITAYATASVLWPITLLIGIGLFVNTKFYKSMYDTIKKDKSLLIIAAIGGMIAGTYMVANHSIFDSFAELIISLFGWGLLLKSSLILALPQTFTDMVSKMKYSNNALKTAGIVYIAIGLYLINFAYYGVLIYAFSGLGLI